MSITPGLIAKALAALAAVAAQAITLGLATGTVAKWITLGIGLCGAIAVYLVPNQTPPVAAKAQPPPPTA